MVFELLNRMMLGNPEEPPKDMALLLELLLELKLELARPLTPEAAATIAELKLGAKGKGLDRQLLAEA